MIIPFLREPHDEVLGLLLVIRACAGHIHWTPQHARHIPQELLELLRVEKADRELIKPRIITFDTLEKFDSDTIVVCRPSDTVTPEHLDLLLNSTTPLNIPYLNRNYIAIDLRRSVVPASAMSFFEEACRALDPTAVLLVISDDGELPLKVTNRVEGCCQGYREVIETCRGCIVFSEKEMTWWSMLLSPHMEWVLCPESVRVPSSIDKRSVEIPAPQKVEGFLLIRPVNGLCNRLRAIVSCSIAADYLKVPLLVFWSASPGFDDSSWEDLFEVPPWFRLVDEETYHRLLPTSVPLDLDDCNGVLEDPVKKAFLGWSGNRLSSVLSIDLRSVGGLGRLISSSYAKDYERLFRTIRPCPRIQKRVDQILTKLPASTCGVHIRRGDALSVSYSHLYTRSSDEHFKTLISRNIDKHIYLSTDSKELWDFYKNRYPGQITGQSDGVWRGSGSADDVKPGQAAAVVDLWVLRGLKEFHGTTFSSFSFHAHL